MIHVGFLKNDFMNDFFNWRRFQALAVKGYAENARSYLGYAAGMLCYFAFLYWNCFDRETGIVSPSKLTMLLPLLSIGLFVVLAISVKLQMKPYFGSLTRTASLTLPASVFEKYLLAWFNSLVLGGCFYLLLFWIAIHGLGGHLPHEIGSKAGYQIQWWILLHSLVFYLNIATPRKVALGIALLFAGLYLAYLSGSFIISTFFSQFEKMSGAPWLLVSNFISGSTTISFRQESVEFLFFFKYIFNWLTWTVLTVAGYYRFKDNQLK